MATTMSLRFESPSMDEIEVLSWSHQSRDGNQMSFTKYLDAASTELMKICWTGKSIGKATLRCLRVTGADDDKPVEYLVIVMQNVVIANYAVSGGPGDMPVDNVTLEYGSISYEYRDRKLMGAKPATATFDVGTGTVS